jgi:hypothetical protein
VLLQHTKHQSCTAVFHPAAAAVFQYLLQAQAATQPEQQEKP